MFSRDCNNVPDETELANYIAEREPVSIGVYSVTQKTTEIFIRTNRSGFEWSIYGIGKRNRVTKQYTASINVAELLTRYRSIPEPITDMVAQYEVYRARDCAVSEAYPGELLMHRHEMVLGGLRSLVEKELYFGALLAIDPTDLFDNGSNGIREENVALLERDIKLSASYLRYDLDRRVGW
jgi:hypothetical protein